MTTADGHRVPDFIIAGAPRCATTWLYHVANAHPQVAMAQPVRPEPKFFLVDALYELGLEHYGRTWFDALPPGRVIGEKTTNYLENAVVAERIRQHLPGVKLVFSLRNPVDRAYSNYLWSRQNGLETLDFADALEREATRDRESPSSQRYSRPFAYFSRGLYADLLQPFFKLFPPEQILVLRTEDVTAAPNDVASRFFEFVGVEMIADLATGLGAVNPTKRGAALSLAVRQQLDERYRVPNERLRVLLGRPSALWPDR